MSTERKTVQMNEQDTVARAIKRNLSPKKAAMLLRRGVHCLATRGVEATGREIAFRANLALGRDAWQHRADIPLRRELHSQRRAVFAHMPLISVVVPLYNTKITYLTDLVECVLKQSYQKFELVLVNASSYDHPEVGEFCAKLHDARVRCVRLAKNGGIASNTNMGFSEARGEYIALLDHDDVLPKNALFEMAKAINDTGAELLYSDEIVLGADLKTLREYHFKPDYSPDTLCGCNYITHFLVFRRELLERAGGGERKDYDGAQDFDLILRLSECANKVHHVPKVLYYWRSHALSTASDIAAKPYALEAGTKAIQAHLLRLGRNGTAESLEGGPGSYRVRYAIVDDPLVSVLIPNKDHVEDLKRCLDSLYTKAGYRNFEVLVLENNSTEQKTFDFYDTGLAGYAGCRVLTYHGDFNFSAINNFGAREAQGDQLLLLNNDIEFLSDGVLDELLMYSQRPDVGAVGAKLYYPDDTIQHAGVFIGLGGTAGHSHKGL
ncbi:MAG: glycosyltransferase, partial [Pygmaiobacter sp.]